MATFLNESVLSLPEQVEKNKNDIKAIEETIGGIDPDLVNQVQTNTSDISAIKQEQTVQNTVINQNGGKITTLETKTANINANGSEYSSVEKIENTNGVIQIKGNGISIENDDITEIFTPNANIVIANSGVVEIKNDNNSNKLEYDGANGSFKVSGGHTLEFDSDTGAITIDGQPIGGGGGGGSSYTHFITWEYGNTMIRLIVVTSENVTYTKTNFGTKICGNLTFIQIPCIVLDTNQGTAEIGFTTIFNNNTCKHKKANGAESQQYTPTSLTDSVV